MGPSPLGRPGLEERPITASSAAALQGTLAPAAPLRVDLAPLEKDAEVPPPAASPFSLSQIGATVGAWFQKAGIATLGAILSRVASLPADDASRRFLPVRGAPLTPMIAADGTPSLAEVFHSLKTIGGGPAQATLLTDNLQSWNARWEMLESAKTSIDSTYFIVEKDPFGYAFLGHLLKKQREGVKVRLLIDAMADTVGKHGFKMPLRGRDYLQELVGAGSEVGVYHPIAQRASKLHNYGLLASNHDKILAVDGQLSMTGGRNIGVEYFAHPADMPVAWRDTDVLLDGAGPAAAMSKGMEDELAHPEVISKVHPDLLGNWKKRDAELLGAYLMMDMWLKDPALTAAEKSAHRADPSLRTKLVDDLVGRTLQALPGEGIMRTLSKNELGFLKVQAASLVNQLESRGSRAAYQESKVSHATEVKILDQTSAVAGRSNDFATALAQLVDAAKDSVVIENPYVVLTEDMILAMERASQRGVKIFIGTNSPLSTDSAVTQAFFLEDWAHILARVPTARIFVATGERKLHAKVATIDDEVSIVSTYNLDLLSGYVNSEIGAVMLSKDFNRDMKKGFLDDRREAANGVLEYEIARDETGKALLQDGKPVVLFGPEQHLPAKVLSDYAPRRETWNTIRAHLPYFTPVRHPTLTDAIPTVDQPARYDLPSE